MQHHRPTPTPYRPLLGTLRPLILGALMGCGFIPSLEPPPEPPDVPAEVTHARTDVQLEIPTDAQLYTKDVSGQITLNCPETTELIGGGTSEQWCERRGTRHGPYMAWSPNGQQRTFGTFNRGRRDGRWSMWFPDGTMESVGQYNQGREQGSWTWWHANGERDTKGDYLNGRRAGVWTKWHQNGQRSEEGVYLNDMKEGEWRTWNDEGTLIRTETWKAHELLTSEDIPLTPPEDTEDAEGTDNAQNIVPEAAP